MPALIGLLAIFFLMFILPLFGAAIGYFCGWVVSLLFNDIILQTLARMGMKTDGLFLSHFGATLGFIGGFFKSRTSINQKKDGDEERNRSFTYRRI